MTDAARSELSALIKSGGFTGPRLSLDEPVWDHYIDLIGYLAQSDKTNNQVYTKFIEALEMLTGDKPNMFLDDKSINEAFSYLSPQISRGLRAMDKQRELIEKMKELMGGDLKSGTAVIAQLKEFRAKFLAWAQKYCPKESLSLEGGRQP